MGLDKDLNQSVNEDVQLTPSVLKIVKTKKASKCHSFLWMLYVTLVVTIWLLGFVRLVSLFMRIRWRNDLDGVFPSACGDWAIGDGCTRVTLRDAGCTRPGDIVSENSLVFPLKDNSPNFMYSQI